MASRPAGSLEVAWRWPRGGQEACREPGGGLEVALRSLEVAGAGARGQQDDRRASVMELVIRENVAAIFRSGGCPPLPTE